MKAFHYLLLQRACCLGFFPLSNLSRRFSILWCSNNSLEIEASRHSQWSTLLWLLTALDWNYGPKMLVSDSALLFFNMYNHWAGFALWKTHVKKAFLAKLYDSYQPLLCCSMNMKQSTDRAICGTNKDVSKVQSEKERPIMHSCCLAMWLGSNTQWKV